jgi:hypothetical protein
MNDLNDLAMGSFFAVKKLASSQLMPLMMTMSI